MAYYPPQPDQAPFVIPPPERSSSSWEHGPAIVMPPDWKKFKAHEARQQKIRQSSAPSKGLPHTRLPPGFSQQVLYDSKNNPQSAHLRIYPGYNLNTQRSVSGKTLRRNYAEHGVREGVLTMTPGSALGRSQAPFDVQPFNPNPNKDEYKYWYDSAGNMYAVHKSCKTRRGRRSSH
eukprot:NODE_5877_length_599_cov_3.180085_g5712_i0.p1 GENE.NODE_5877_length_599_cov_3.180085_g5712_i0~~NODE_5877_length_599_cov_3.180085_g5712_i0.p1  ORF type:complete len:176 (+),score=13.88 NODE_5877_length_599_cov_3.180085_g5712_i0:36-563(+)